MTDVINDIVNSINYQKMIRHDSNPAFGQFVVAGYNGGPAESRLGYCVQVRKKVGQFGSDIVFLRHASGTLTAHENNCYVAVTEEQEALARSVFKLLPDDEEPEKGYSDPAGVHETGFVIENSASNASTGGPSVAITVYSRKEDLQ
ncbi:TPA: plasmid protein [Klebsiella pneumoniae]|uniref:plasmid protein n=1 Tax=Enterobacteriaceae TaxID=543 RepID=UPI000E6A1B0B|nr:MULTISPECIES: plasmid protein [Enterobacteriaceae]RIU55357.1 plasmid protein [Klebsiella pneumoniae]TXQ48949.1 plasmid protein [Escherichia coli]HEL6195864.1 plasmid protein [Klebsiella pneumoniae]HEL6304652.1 plasmid protein [Klebsiella pneumoniae]HEL6496068.1 plasmid protein [Klebsiella pneumoniae]